VKTDKMYDSADKALLTIYPLFLISNQQRITNKDNAGSKSTMTTKIDLFNSHNTAATGMHVSHCVRNGV